MVRKALVVDDDDMILYLLEYVLESRGYAITRASYGDLSKPWILKILIWLSPIFKWGGQADLMSSRKQKLSI